ncbi:hypothetical protein J7I94_12015 [Streptomyces sp. ISL-12]|uniref:hypothetical protein n=1 Tax=Streptomyces sp. ISL-12 TaxID=2819177 RepID=UPI001BE8AEE5|nr:hypothetical protein [Streptomyces sp. ISL-12]MBT2411284.1 hypothetical protein [Streptomyces sp. ISL-12]
MHKSSCALVAALAVALAFPVPSADAAAVRVPGDVTAIECLEGGGSLLVEWDGQGGFVRQCQGGVHDGEALVPRPVSPLAAEPAR